MKTPTIITTSVNRRPGEGAAKLSNAKNAHTTTNAVTNHHGYPLTNVRLRIALTI